MLRTWYVAGLLAGIFVFIWGGLAHNFLGLGGESTFKIVPNATLAAMAFGIQDPGLYMLSYSKDRNETTRMMEKYPSGIMVYAPPGTTLSMGRLLGTQAVSDILACLVAAWLFSLALPKLPTPVSQVGFVLGLGAFGFLMADIQYWNWYRFPTNFTAFAFAYKFSAALLAGLVLSRLMGRKSASA